MHQVDSNKLIWYNPDTKSHQWGTYGDLDTKKTESLHKEEFTILFKFNATSEKMIHQLIEELNGKIVSE
jgi:hypothetical protein